jgi:FG-GAP-like repeat
MLLHSMLDVILQARPNVHRRRPVVSMVLLASGLCVLPQTSSDARNAARPAPISAQDVVLPVGKGPAPIAVADVNHDGYLDILVANADDRTLSVLLGDGRGRFRPAPDPLIPTGESPNDIAVGDFNGDGNLDLVIANTGTPNLTVLLGDGHGGFHPSPHSPFATTSYPHVHGVAVGDFNGDGKLDVVTDSWGHDQILLLLGDGAGNLLLPGRLFHTGKRPYQRLRAADFNRDGTPDVVTTDLDRNAVSILLGDGTGGFRDGPGSPVPAGAAPWAVAIDDINKDGKLDLVTIPYDRDVRDPRDIGVTVLLGDGTGGFAKMPGSPFSLSECQGPEWVATGDFNGDGLRDIAVSCAQSNSLTFLLGQRGGGFQASVRRLRDIGWSGLAVGDFDGDGKDDVVVANRTSGTVTVLFGRSPTGRP